MDESHHGFAADKSAASVRCYHVSLPYNIFQFLLQPMPQTFKAVMKEKSNPVLVSEANCR